ncbi:MAG TPA: cupredoxin domain-containing protein [Candidatus Paceibacterota bacterium]|jgi:nitrosocyanin|nr:cupredoxin domain-containing protein [Candidatus Paceibacterota bacterium]
MKNTVIWIIVIVVLVLLGIYAVEHRSNPLDTGEEATTTPLQTDENGAEGQTGSETASSSVENAPIAATSGEQSGASADVNARANVAAPAAEKTFTVSGKNFTFTPSTITVNKGDKVKIVFQNTEGTHSFQIDGYNVGTQTIAAGQEATVEFTADKAGSFQYYCSVGTHRQMGMVGTLVVQ